MPGPLGEVRLVRLQSCLDLQNRTWWQQQRHIGDVAVTTVILPAKNLPWRPCAVFKLNDKNSKFPSITQGFPWRMSNEYRVSTSTIFSSSGLCIFMSSRSPLNGTVSVPTNSITTNFFLLSLGFFYNTLRIVFIMFWSKINIFRESKKLFFLPLIQHFPPNFCLCL